MAPLPRKDEQPDDPSVIIIARGAPYFHKLGLCENAVPSSFRCSWANVEGRIHVAVAGIDRPTVEAAERRMRAIRGHMPLTGCYRLHDSHENLARDALNGMAVNGFPISL